MSRGQLCLLSCVRLTKWVPVLFVFSVTGWSYYAYVFVLCFSNVDDWLKRISFLILYHVFLVMLIWSYLKTVFTPVKKPSHEFYLRETDIYEMELSQSEMEAKLMLEKKAKELPLMTRTHNGNIRYCDKCKCVKPDRAHHCSVCQTCVLRMDHHCPWVNNCVGQSNYKHFILFLLYAVLFCLFIAASSLEFFIKFWDEIQTFHAGKFHLLFLFFVSIMFGISIISLLSYHLYLISKNRTTLETFRPAVFMSNGLPDKNGFSLNKLENFKQVFGNSLFRAFLPIHTGPSVENGRDFLLSQDRINSLKAKRNSSKNTHKSSSSYNKKKFFTLFTFKTKNHLPQEEFNYHSGTVSHVPANDFLTSLDITREVNLPKANESILKEMPKQSDEIALSNSSKIFTINNRMNTFSCDKSTITFASVFKNQSFSLTHSFEENNKSLGNITHNNTGVTDKSGMVDGFNYPLSIRQLEAFSLNENNTRLIGNSSNSLLSNNAANDHHVNISMNN